MIMFKFKETKKCRNENIKEKKKNFHSFYRKLFLFKYWFVFILFFEQIEITNKNIVKECIKKE